MVVDLTIEYEDFTGSSAKVNTNYVNKHWGHILIANHVPQ